MTKSQPKQASKSLQNSESTPATESSRSQFAIPFLTVIIAVVLSGVVHGVIDGRWSTQADLVTQGSELQELPESLGNWDLLEKRELEADAAEMLRCYGSEVRVYRHESTGSMVTVAVLFGPRGPIAVHTPEICYSSVGTQQVGSRQVETIRLPDGPQKFWSVKFAKDPSPTPTEDVWYGWSNGQEWVASEHPRFWMTDNLYKIQVAGPVGDGQFRPVEDFLTEFLPNLRPLIH